MKALANPVWPSGAEDRRTRSKAERASGGGELRDPYSTHLRFWTPVAGSPERRFQSLKAEIRAANRRPVTFAYEGEKRFLVHAMPFTIEVFLVGPQRGGHTWTGIIRPRGVVFQPKRNEPDIEKLRTSVSPDSMRLIFVVVPPKYNGEIEF